MVLINIQHFFSVLMIFYVQLLGRVQIFATLWTATCQASLSSLSPRVCSNSCPLNWRCHPTISSSPAPFSSCAQSFLASGSFPVSRLSASLCLEERRHRWSEVYLSCFMIELKSVSKQLWLASSYPQFFLFLGCFEKIKVMLHGARKNQEMV